MHHSWLIIPGAIHNLYGLPSRDKHKLYSFVVKLGLDPSPRGRLHTGFKKATFKRIRPPYIGELELKSTRSVQESDKHMTLMPAVTAATIILQGHSNRQLIEKKVLLQRWAVSDGYGLTDEMLRLAGSLKLGWVTASRHYTS